MSFVHEYGVRKKKKALTFKAPVQDLKRIRAKGKIFKKLYIEFEYGKYEFTLPSKSTSRVIEYILLARTFDETTVYDSKSASNLQKVNIDLNSLTDYIEESINSFFSLKCQYNKSYENINSLNKNPSQYTYINPNQIQNIAPLNYQQGIPYQNPNLGQNQFNQPRLQNPNYQNRIYQNPNMGQIGFNQPRMQNVNYQKPPNYQYTQGIDNYMNQANQYQIPPRSESNFFPQNICNPNRYQNYNPQEINNNYDVLLNADKRDVLPRNLEQTQGIFPQTSNIENHDMFNDNPFQRYNKNHLSDLFNSTNSSAQQPYGYKRKLFKLDKDKQKKMLDLKKDLYSLKATLKKLEAKFDQGSISESDYFRTFKNLNKETYLIETKIQTLQQSLEELEAIKQNSRNFDKKGFYT